MTAHDSQRKSTFARRWEVFAVCFRCSRGIGGCDEHPKRGGQAPSYRHLFDDTLRFNEGARQYIQTASLKCQVRRISITS
jgi:hypothetical protein